jgi:hypothetical protein
MPKNRDSVTPSFAGATCIPGISAFHPLAKVGVAPISASALPQSAMSVSFRPDPGRPKHTGGRNNDREPNSR